MSNHIDFYFDIISPYAYIAYKKILIINNVNFKLKPILLGGLHNLAGITAPAFNKYKMKNMQNDCELVAKKNNINFKWNSRFPINSLHIMRGYLCVKDDTKEEYLNSFFEAYWKEDQDLSKEENIKIPIEKTKNHWQVSNNIKIRTNVLNKLCICFNNNLSYYGIFLINQVL